MEPVSEWTAFYPFVFGYMHPEGARTDIDNFHLPVVSNIEKHKYRGVDLSPFSIYVLQPLWGWLLRRVPLHIAPNVITLAGVVAVLIAYILHVMFIPTFAEEAPPAVYFISGIAIFIYSACDNLDGGQARRTKSGYASPARPTPMSAENVVSLMD